MTFEFLNNLIESKINQNNSIIKFTFYELRIKYNLSSDDTIYIVNLIKQKLNNYGYKVYLLGDKYTYHNKTFNVKSNELLVAIK